MAADVHAPFQALIAHLAKAPADIRPLVGDEIAFIGGAVGELSTRDEAMDLCRTINDRIKPANWYGVSNDKAQTQRLLQWLAGVDHHNVVAFSTLSNQD